MSFYNALFGMSAEAPLLMAMLELSPKDAGRFRDCYLDVEGLEPLIAVYTRNGGGNREDYEEVTAALQAHPEYEEDEDDEFDSTYATYRFRVPEKFKATVEMLVQLKTTPTLNGAQKFQQLFEKLKTGNTEDPAVARALEVGKTILGSFPPEVAGQKKGVD